MSLQNTSSTHCYENDISLSSSLEIKPTKQVSTCSLPAKCTQRAEAFWSTRSQSDAGPNRSPTYSHFATWCDKAWVTWLMDWLIGRGISGWQLLKDHIFFKFYLLYPPPLWRTQAWWWMQVFKLSSSCTLVDKCTSKTLFKKFLDVGPGLFTGHIEVFWCFFAGERGVVGVTLRFFNSREIC